MKTKNIGITKYFINIEDPRIARNKQHLLLDIIILTIFAVICGAESWESIELYGNTKLAFLKTILDLPSPKFDYGGQEINR